MGKCLGHNQVKWGKGREQKIHTMYAENIIYIYITHRKNTGGKYIKMLTEVLH